jgi:hypothetical protein
MSHISKIEVEIKDLDSLARACGRLDLKFAKNQKVFKWYGAKGECDHAIKVPGATYEIGVKKAKNGEGYELICDYYDKGIEKVIGKQGGLLKQAYAVEKTKAEARRKGYTVIEKSLETGVRLQLRLS